MPEHAHNRAADAIHTAAHVIHETWPDIQDNDELRDLVLHLSLLCGASYSGNPPLADEHLNKIDWLYDTRSAT